MAVDTTGSRASATSRTSFPPSGTFRKEVDKGAVDPNKLVEVWRSPLIPNGPIVYRTALGDAFGAQVKVKTLPTTSPRRPT